jgi:hypothetical protein
MRQKYGERESKGEPLVGYLPYYRQNYEELFFDNDTNPEGQAFLLQKPCRNRLC